MLEQLRFTLMVTYLLTLIYLCEDHLDQKLPLYQAN
jgi:hypothetical protein